jgi:hypothetical protein
MLTLDGQPLADATIAFYASGQLNVEMYASRSSADGNYELRTAAPEGIKGGTYKVTVAKWTAKESVPAGLDVEQLRRVGKTANTVPSQYADADKTPLEVEVNSGNNAIDLSLKSSP